MLDKEQAKEALLKLVTQEQRAFQVRLDQYHRLDNPTAEQYAQLNAALIESLERIEDLYKSSEGQDSLFLKRTIMPLLAALDEAIATRESLGVTSEEVIAEQINQSLSEDHVRVYIVLYQADGANLSKWVLQLLSLDRLLATRPVYLDEEAAKQACRTGSDAMAKGYLSAVIKKSALVHDELSARRKDASGRALLLLKDGAIADGGHIEYLSLGRERYQWAGNRLLPIFPENDS